MVLLILLLMDICVYAFFYRRFKMQRQALPINSYMMIEWVSIGSDGRSEILTSIQGFASQLSLMPPKFGVVNESYYWGASYHFNIKLYEKLLSSVFDVLEDCQIVEEAEEIIKVLKMTWPTLGVTQKMHDALYSWLLFHQFVRTGEPSLLNYAVPEMQKALSNKEYNGCEEAYMKSLICLTGFYGSKRALNLVDAILFNIFAWCASQLEDYHLHFGQEKLATFESVLKLALLCGKYSANIYGGIKYVKPLTGDEAASNLVHIFVETSIKAAYRRVLHLLDDTSERKVQHPLTMVANELKSIAEKELVSFIPALQKQYPEAGVLVSLQLHQLFGKQLKSYLESISSLSEDVHLSDGVHSVLAASNSLERRLFDILNLIYGDDMKLHITNYFHPYQIRDVCSPLILHWVNSQHANILEWTKRAIQLEGWEPLSSQQKQAASIIEVFRIIEETVDQFFDLCLPMDIIHLRSLLIGIFHSLDAYLLHMDNQQVDKRVLYPQPPPLTRYKESLNPFMKKKSAEGVVLEENVVSQLDNLSVSKLCVKLNTLYYIRQQLDMLEDSIKQSWVSVSSANLQVSPVIMEEPSVSSDLVDELFTIFDDIRRSAIGISSAIVDFIGARVIFWDMGFFLSLLYRCNVESARLENFVPQLDEVLNCICDLIIDILRTKLY
ncbi:uncharacterized protein M6B38_398250 [Iris pallida]|uniref:MHD1 domain-containing protein n=1 Tax=Iris pallida TaxID=29817 RepID=A0AAX6FVE7_IRIPA|nr:uncharacterized protein M6B38_398250 [Iris pallida]